MELIIIQKIKELKIEAFANLFSAYSRLELNLNYIIHSLILRIKIYKINVNQIYEINNTKELRS